jgi:hypothetical protein
MVRLTARLFFIFLLSGMMLGYAAEVSAICCKCTASGSKDVICLTGEAASCPALVNGSEDPAIKGYSCESSVVPPELCRPAVDKGVCKSIQGVVTGSGAPISAPSSQPLLTVPSLSVDIPGLEMSPVPHTVKGGVIIPFLSQYISAFYKFLLGLTVVVTAVMIMYGGFKYIIGSSVATIQDGKEIIQNALVGMVLVFCSFVFLNLVNPDAASLKPLTVQIVKRDIMLDFLLENGTTHEGALNPDPRQLVNPAIPPPASSGAPVSSGGAGTSGGTTPSGGASTPEGTTPSGGTTPSPGGAGTSGGTTPSGGASTPEGTTPSGGTAVAALPPDQIVDVSNIGYDKSIGATQNIYRYCSKGAEVSGAKTYEEKTKLLVKAVMGYYTTCIQNAKCVYTQAGATNVPGGAIGSAKPFANWAVNSLVNRGLASLETIWPSNPECIDTWKQKGGQMKVNDMPQCNEPARALFNSLINRRIEEAKVFASDCVMFVISAYACAGPKFQMWGDGIKEAINQLMKGKGQSSAFFSKPQLIVFTKMTDPNLQAKLDKKGGLKFGDVIYVCCGGFSGQNNMHFYMYTGGRPDVPFTFIEMGGGPPGTNVPGVGHMGGASIKTVSLAEDIANKTASTKVWPWYCPQNGCTRHRDCKKSCTEADMLTKPAAYNPKTALIMVWRPYAETDQTIAAEGGGGQ